MGLCLGLRLWCQGGFTRGFTKNCATSVGEDGITTRTPSASPHVLALRLHHRRYHLRSMSEEPSPTAGELADAIKAMLTDVFGEEISLKSVRQGLETKFGVPLSERKAEIKTAVMDFFSLNPSMVHELKLDDELKKRWDCGGEWYFGCSSNIPSAMRQDFDLVCEAYEAHVRRRIPRSGTIDRYLRRDEVSTGHKPLLTYNPLFQTNFPLMLCKTVVGSQHLVHGRNFSEEILITSEYIVGFPVKRRASERVRLINDGKVFEVDEDSFIVHPDGSDEPAYKTGFVWDFDLPVSELTSCCVGEELEEPVDEGVFRDWGVFEITTEAGSHTGYSLTLRVRFACDDFNQRVWESSDSESESESELSDLEVFENLVAQMNENLRLQ